MIVMSFGATIIYDVYLRWNMTGSGWPTVLCGPYSSEPALVRDSVTD